MRRLARSIRARVATAAARLREAAGARPDAGAAPTPATAGAPAEPSRLPPSFQRYAAYIDVHPTAEIAPTAALKIFTLPDPPQVCLSIGASSHVFSTFSILRPSARITIGERCQLGASSFICAERIDVEDDVLMAWNITLMDNDAHALAWAERAEDAAIFLADWRADPENALRNKPWGAVAMAPISIGKRCWIGFGAAILKGVRLDEETVVGAASVVTRSMPAGVVVAGNPAGIVRRIA